jgi:hypothetical protein
MLLIGVRNPRGLLPVGILEVGGNLGLLWDLRRDRREGPEEGQTGPEEGQEDVKK